MMLSPYHHMQEVCKYRVTQAANPIYLHFNVLVSMTTKANIHKNQVSDNPKSLKRMYIKRSSMPTHSEDLRGSLSHKKRQQSFAIIQAKIAK
jgi:hypothetical protein